MESQGDINNNEDLLNILWNDNSNIPLQFPSWSEDQGQQIDPDSMQNNAFARNPAPSPAYHSFNFEAAIVPAGHGNSYQGIPNPSPASQGYGYGSIPHYGHGQPAQLQHPWPQYPPHGQQWGMPNTYQMPQQQSSWDQNPYVQDRLGRYRRLSRQEPTRGHQQPVPQYEQQYGQQLGHPYGQQLGRPYGQQLGPPFGQQPAPQSPSFEQFTQKLKEPATDEFKHVIKNFDEAEQCYRMYLSLGDVDRKPLEDIRGREGELVGRLYSAIRYAVRDDEGPEAETPASGPGGQGQKKRKRTGTKGLIDAAIRRKSGIELEMVCHQLLEAIREAQAGRNKIPGWYTAKPNGYGRFDTLDGRFNAVEQVLMNSNSMTKSLFDGADWQARIAWNPEREFQRKSSNKQINKERAVLLKAGNAVIRGQRNNDANDANDAQNNDDNDDPKIDEPMAYDLDAGNVKADDSEPAHKVLKTVHHADLPHQVVDFGSWPQDSSALPMPMELDPGFAAMNPLMPTQGAPEFIDHLMPTQGAPEFIDHLSSTPAAPVFSMGPSLPAQGAPFPMAAPSSTQDVPLFISDTPSAPPDDPGTPSAILDLETPPESQSDPLASLEDSSASLAVPTVSMAVPAASLDDPSASLAAPSASLAVPSAPLADPLEGLGPIVDYVAAPSSQAVPSTSQAEPPLSQVVPSMDPPIAGQEAPVGPFYTGSNKDNDIDSVFDGEFDFDQEIENFSWNRPQDDGSA